MDQANSTSIAPYTSLRCGGTAERFYEVSTRDQVVSIISELQTDEPLWVIGFGSNSLISDEGLPGTTIVWRGGDIWQDGTMVVADAGVWWDELVTAAIQAKLWGLELMSEIPSSVGGAVFGNIAAYGQQVSDTLLWVEVYDRVAGTTKRLLKQDIQFAYRESSLQSDTSLIILQVAFQLSDSPLHRLKYAAATDVAVELGLVTDSLTDLRQIIIETRRRAGSIWHPDDPNAQRTAGSFFKNPLVNAEQAEKLASYDETGKTLERVRQQNQIHGGSTMRASAAHVLLAAGFARGQTWGAVRLHPQHVLKIETLPGATAQEVYDVTREIITTVKDTLDITVEPEVRFLGDFK